MKADLTVETKTYILCPSCHRGRSRIDHLSPGEHGRHFGPWNCDDCGSWYKGYVNSPTDVDVELLDVPRDVRVLDVLVLPPQDRPIYFVVSTKDYGGDPGDKQHYYNEHTCPTNWIHHVARIVEGDDFDPHGLFLYAATRVFPAAADANDEDVIDRLAEEVMEKLRDNPANGKGI